MKWTFSSILLEHLFSFTWQHSRISWACGTGNDQCKFRQNIKCFGQRGKGQGHLLPLQKGGEPKPGGINTTPIRSRPSPAGATVIPRAGDTAGLGVQEAAGTPRVLADQGETGDPGVEVTQECIRDLILYQDPLTVLQGPNQGVRDPS